MLGAEEESCRVFRIRERVRRRCRHRKARSTGPLNVNGVRSRVLSFNYGYVSDELTRSGGSEWFRKPFTRRNDVREVLRQI